jgi:class 3 adenylate cyclase
MSERINKTSICSVVFLDIIDYSKMSVSDQSDLKEHFNALINEAIKDIAQNDRIILDTGDGAAISLLGAPEEALFVSMTIRDSILVHNKQYPDQQLFVRIGINLGPVRVVSDINGQPNIIGDGINVAQRVMSFAEPNQILVSRSYYEVTSRLTKEITGMFTYSGIKHDKHVREHEVYVIRSTDEVASAGTPSPVITEDALAPNAVAETQPVNRKVWLAMGALFLALLAAALYRPTQMDEPQLDELQPMAEMPAAAPLATVPDLPAAQPSLVIEPVAASEPAPQAVAEMPKPVEKKQAKRKPVVVENKKSEPAIPQAASNESTKASRKDSTSSVADKPVPVAVEHQVEIKEKSGWDSFKDSVKQGTKRECTQGEMALNQCK